MSQFRSELSDCPRGIDAGAYVLDALGQEEYPVYAAHVAECVHCTREIAALQLVVDTLPIAAPQTAPSAALKSRIMSVVDAESELLRAAGSGPDRAPAEAPRRRRLPAWFTAPVRPAFAGALACALLAFGVVGGLAVERAAEGETTTLAAWAVGPADARLTQTGDKAALELTRMPSLSKGQVYQVWLDRGDGSFAPSRTLFNVRPDGRATVAIEESAKDVERIAVTVEPTSGAQAPSGDPVITASTA